VTTVPERIAETETFTCRFCEEPFTLNPTTEPGQTTCGVCSACQQLRKIGKVVKYAPIHGVSRAEAGAFEKTLEEDADL
jgi:hypothetical protein